MASENTLLIILCFAMVRWCDSAVVGGWLVVGLGKLDSARNVEAYGDERVIADK